MNKSESIKNLTVALKQAQSEMGGVEFDSTNPFYKSKYASLGAVINASKDALAKHGLTVSQPPVTNEFGVGVTTILMHDSGEFIETTVTIPVTDQKNMAQEAGKAITYLRRYSLASILNLYSEEDTDGNAPQKKAQPEKQAKQTAGMTLEEAMAMVGGSDGKKYGDCTTEELQGKRIGLKKWLDNPANSTDKNFDTYMDKLNAVTLILNSRK